MSFFVKNILSVLLPPYRLPVPRSVPGDPDLDIRLALLSPAADPEPDARPNLSVNFGLLGETGPGAEILRWRTESLSGGESSEAVKTEETFSRSVSDPESSC